MGPAHMGFLASFSPIFSKEHSFPRPLFAQAQHIGLMVNLKSFFFVRVHCMQKNGRTLSSSPYAKSKQRITWIVVFKELPGTGKLWKANFLLTGITFSPWSGLLLALWEVGPKRQPEWMDGKKSPFQGTLRSEISLSTRPLKKILTRGAKSCLYRALCSSWYNTIAHLEVAPEGSLEGASAWWILWRNDHGDHQRDHHELRCSLIVSLQ